jgi:hypothetical protein
MKKRQGVDALLAEFALHVGEAGACSPAGLGVGAIHNGFNIGLLELKYFVWAQKE